MKVEKHKTHVDLAIKYGLLRKVHLTVSLGISDVLCMCDTALALQYFSNVHKGTLWPPLTQFATVIISDCSNVKWLREDFVQKLCGMRNEEDTVKTLLALRGSDNSTSTGMYWHQATPSPTTPVALISSIHSPVHFSPNLYFSPTYNARNLPLNSLNYTCVLYLSYSPSIAYWLCPEIMNCKMSTRL